MDPDLRVFLPQDLHFVLEFPGLHALGVHDLVVPVRMQDDKVRLIGKRTLVLPRSFCEDDLPVKQIPGDLTGSVPQPQLIKEVRFLLTVKA